MSIRLTFWGVRGSIPVPGPDDGEVRREHRLPRAALRQEDRLVIIDLGHRHPRAGRGGHEEGP